jgi:hypothetical protein
MFYKCREPRDIVCLRNISVDTLHKGDTDDDDDDDDGGGGGDDDDDDDDNDDDGGDDDDNNDDDDDDDLSCKTEQNRKRFQNSHSPEPYE